MAILSQLPWFCPVPASCAPQLLAVRAVLEAGKSLTQNKPGSAPPKKTLAYYQHFSHLKSKTHHSYQQLSGRKLTLSQPKAMHGKELKEREEKNKIEIREINLEGVFLEFCRLRIERKDGMEMLVTSGSGFRNVLLLTCGS